MLLSRVNVEWILVFFVGCFGMIVVGFVYVFGVYINVVKVYFNYI